MEEPPDVSSAELAAALRDQILTGVLPPGARLPSEKTLGQTHGVSRAMIRQALAILRGEGLVVTRQAHTTRVRPKRDKQPIDLAGVVRVETRMPTAPERQRLDDDVPGGFDAGIPVFVVYRVDAAAPELLPGDRWLLAGPAQAEGL
ncbi:winged helix-turn-helix domain-containing protein [Micromonospora sp. MED01]|uniref:GntR family transcriptional regulator n=1 Tax=Micromonospora alfalfae TaxID=2911212 RepID=UPI001EE97D95|nr:winged helix-turn-helix domain-containing protein [Micromonospora alfalfae]MCG5464328.1 winged helix-turn-helix domain-containing protein [Micromonospora alfalfae]